MNEKLMNSVISYKFGQIIKNSKFFTIENIFQNII